MKLSSLRFSVSLCAILAVVILGSVYAAFMPVGDEEILGDDALPRDIVGDEMKEEYTFLTSISHLGISLETRDDVDRVAAMAKEEGTLVLGPMYRNEVVGYICLLRDPDGNNVEFSVEQDLG